MNQTCSRCLYSKSHPFGLAMDSEGICSGCRVHEEKDWIDWQARWEDLVQLAKPYRSLHGRTHDCIVPVTGGGDSYFVVHTLKNRLGLNPLVVSYNHQFSSPLGIRNLARLREVFDVPLRQKTVSPTSIRKIVRATLMQLGSVYWHAIAGQTVFPVQVAIETGIPLVIWGAHQGVEQVGMFSHLDGAEMTRRYRKEHDLMGFEADDLLIPYSDLTEEDVWQFRYPDDSQLMAHGIRGVYLSNFVRWDPIAQNSGMSRTYGFRGARLPGTFDPYDYVDSLVYMGFHDHLKRMKCGYGKAVDHAVREIRHGRLTRDEALGVVAQFEEPREIAWMHHLAEWLGANPRGLLMAADAHRDPRFWRRTDLREWVRVESRVLSRATAEPTSTLMSGLRDNEDAFTDVEPPDSSDGFVLFGRGFPY